MRAVIQSEVWATGAPLSSQRTPQLCADWNWGNEGPPPADATGNTETAWRAGVVPGRLGYSLLMLEPAQPSTDAAGTPQASCCVALDQFHPAPMSSEKGRQNFVQRCRRLLRIANGAMPRRGCSHEPAGSALPKFGIELVRQQK